MFLRRIRLINFKCFEDLELSFSHEDGSIRKWTLLLGENGVGKSNLLQAIALITAGSNALGDLINNPADWIQYKKSFCEIQATLVTKEGQERELKLHIKRKDNLSQIIIQNKDSLKLIDAAIENADRNYFVIGYGAARRLNAQVGIGSDVIGEHFRGRAQNVASLFDKNAPLHPIESWAMDMDYRNLKSGMSTVRKVLNDFLPDVSFERIDKRARKLMFKTTDGIIPLQLLSDGYQNMVGWVGDLLYRITETFKDYKSPLSARGVLLIDEVALHLHLKWQKQLVSFMKEKFPNFQVIVTTHSPITAQQAGAGELHYFERNKKRITIQEFSGTPKTLLLHQLITADVFGLDSDESADITEKKQQYRTLKQKKSLSSKDKKILVQLEKELGDTPAIKRNNLTVEQKHLELMEQIQKDLLEKKK